MTDEYKVVRLSRLKNYLKSDENRCTVCDKKITVRDIMSAYFKGSSFLIDKDNDIVSVRYFSIKCNECMGKKNDGEPLLILDDTGNRRL
jgi:hypothetical protein